MLSGHQVPEILRSASLSRAVPGGGGGFGGEKVKLRERVPLLFCQKQTHNTKVHKKS